MSGESTVSPFHPKQPEHLEHFLPPKTAKKAPKTTILERFLIKNEAKKSQNRLKNTHFCTIFA